MNMDLFSGGDRETVKAARLRVMKEAQQSKGTHCPCCDRFVKIYRRKLNAGMAASLIWLMRYSDSIFDAGGSDFVNVPAVAPRFVQRSREIGKMKWWGLTRSAPAPGDGAKKHSGLHKVTTHGRMFAQGRIKVASHVLIYEDKVLGFEGGRIGIQEALGKRFHYRELMSDSPRWDLL